MNHNPFSSETFKKIWRKHFYDSKPELKFKFIENISFIRNKFQFYYVNLGVNVTHGLTYKILNSESNDFKGKVFLIRDIPDYYKIENLNSSGSLKLKKLFQYEGFITEVKNYEDLDQYMRSNFKSNTRYKFKRNIERLESCFSIDYVMYHGEINKAEFDHVFKEFYKLLDKRYTNKKERCGELAVDLWSYYCDLAYNMILEKTGSLFVIYNDKKPIGITFSYHFDDVFIEALTVFDIDYYKFNIGHTTIYKLLEWSFNNRIRVFDYTHGDFDYKRRWSSNTYKKYHHLLYDSSSLRSKILVNYISKKFNIKRRLRDMNFIKKYHKFKYNISQFSKKSQLDFSNYNVRLANVEIPSKDELESIDIYSNLYTSQRKYIFDFIYKFPEPIDLIEFYKHNQKKEVYYAFCKTKILLITLDNS